MGPLPELLPVVAPGMPPAVPVLLEAALDPPELADPCVDESPP
jgi:hypothetical protein